MSFAAIALRRPVTRVPWKTLLLATAAVGTAVVLSLFGLRSRHALLHDAVPILLTPLALWLFFSERYEVTLAVLLLYLGLVDGVVKLGSGSTVATLGRDVVLYAIVVGAVLRTILRRTPITLPRLTGLVLAWVAVCVMQLANPSDISLVHAAAALRQHLEFVPLFFFGYFVVRSKRRLTGLLVLLVVIGAANGVVDLIQSRLSPSQLASWGPGYAGLEYGTATRVARVFIDASNQARVRPPGLGGTDGFGGIVCLIALPCALALLSAWRTARLGWILLPATLLTIVGVVASQTRLALVDAVITTAVFLALTLTSRRGIAVLLVTTVVGLAGYFIISSFVASNPNRYAPIAPAHVITTGTSEIAFKGSLSLIPSDAAHYPLGAGLGTVGPAAESTVGGVVEDKGLSGEGETTFLLVELGIPGLLVMLAFTIATVRIGLRLHRVVDPVIQRSLMALTAVLIGLFASWVVGPTTGNSPTAPFIWLSSGCLIYWYCQVRLGRLAVRGRRLRASLDAR